MIKKWQAAKIADFQMNCLITKIWCYVPEHKPAGAKYPGWVFVCTQEGHDVSSYEAAVMIERITKDIERAVL